MTNDQNESSGSSRWLDRYSLDMLRSVLERAARIDGKVEAIQANQITNREMLFTYLKAQQDRNDQRIDDLKNEIFPRFSRVETDIRALQAQASTPKPADISTPSARSLLMLAVKAGIEKFPWGHFFLTLPAVLLGFAGQLWHLLPDWLQAVLAYVLGPVLRAFGAAVP